MKEEPTTEGLVEVFLEEFRRGEELLRRGLIP